MIDKKLPNVSVIVPVYNGQATIQRCLDSLIQLDYPKEKLEIIVVDNNSTDDTKKIIKRYPVIYVFEERRSRARARNKGIKASSGEIICSLDADCIAQPGWVRNLLKGFRSQNIGACGGGILAYEPKTLIEKYLNYTTSNFATIFRDNRFLTPSISTANAAYPKAVFEKIGFFDERITTEDQEFSWRVILNGWQLAYVPEAVVYCKYLDNIVKFIVRFFHSGVDPIRVTQKYKSLINPPTGINLWIEVINEICQLLKPALVNLFTGKYEYPRIFSLLEIIRFQSMFLGSGYRWLEMKLGGEDNSPNFLLPKDKVTWWGDEQKITFLDPRSAYYYNLNDTGSKIWEMLKAGKNTDEIVNSISQEYQVDKEQIQIDVLDFIDSLRERNFLGT